MAEAIKRDGVFKRLKSRMAEAIKRDGVLLDEQTSEKLMEEEGDNAYRNYEDDSFQAIFWKTQKECAAKVGKEFVGTL